MTFTGKRPCSAGDLLWKLYGVNAGSADGAASSATEPKSSPPGLVDSAKEGAASMRGASSPGFRTEAVGPGVFACLVTPSPCERLRPEGRPAPVRQGPATTTGGLTPRHLLFGHTESLHDIPTPSKDLKYHFRTATKRRKRKCKLPKDSGWLNYISHRPPPASAD